MDESNVPKHTEHGFNFFDDIVDVVECCEQEPKEMWLEDPCDNFHLTTDKIHQFDEQSVAEVQHLWWLTDKQSSNPKMTMIYPFMGQTTEEVNALLELSEKQGERDPNTVEKIVISEQTIEEVKKHIQLLENMKHEYAFFSPPVVCTARKKRKTKYERLKEKHARLEKRVADLEELCQSLIRKDQNG